MLFITPSNKIYVHICHVVAAVCWVDSWALFGECESFECLERVSVMCTRFSVLMRPINCNCPYQLTFYQSFATFVANKSSCQLLFYENVLQTSPRASFIRSLQFFLNIFLLHFLSPLLPFLTPPLTSLAILFFFYSL